MSRPPIPIKNIYYMLCYAWDVLPRDIDKIIGLEKFDNIHNLLAKILVEEINRLVKRGFHREYIHIEGELVVPRGKLQITSSLRRQSMIRKRLVCDYDEFSEDAPFNQILKATLNFLMKSPFLNPKLKKGLIGLRCYFANIEEIRLCEQSFAVLKYNRNNMHYKILMSVCYLCYQGLVADSSGNEVKFASFLRDKQMATLYEKFVLNFYKKHLPTQKFRTHSPKIEWNLDEQFGHVGLNFLPDMNTDIVIEDKENETQLIIDTKYYTSALSKHTYGEAKKLISGNLYQILTYVSNSTFPGTVSGMLLYPTTEKVLDLQYKIGGSEIKIKTLNLNTDWEDIYKRLISIV